MLPCASAGLPSPNAARFLWLYESPPSDWPYRWERKRQILFDRLNLQGRPMNPVLFFYESDQTWYLMILDDGSDQERIFFSDKVDGGYLEHPQSKQYKQRHAGRIAVYNGQIWAFFQTRTAVDTALTVTARRIEEISRVRFRYCNESEIVAGSFPNIRHASEGMHTFDAHKIGSRWVAAVDGWFFDEEYLMWWCLAANEQNSLCWHQISKGESVNTFLGLRCNCFNYNLWEMGLSHNETKISTLLESICPLTHSTAASLVTSLLKTKPTVVEYGCSESTLFYSKCAGHWITLALNDSACKEVLAVKPDGVQIISPILFAKHSTSPRSGGGDKELSACGARLAAELSNRGDVGLVFMDHRGGSECAFDIHPWLSPHMSLVLYSSAQEPDWWQSSLDSLLLMYRVAESGNGRMVLQPRPFS